MNDFSELLDLAAARLGGAVVAANDEFFGAKESLLRPEAPVHDPDRYTERGKWMDGWETRRRRQPGTDWAIVRLGVPGVLHGVEVDTTHFRGNAPEAVSLEAVSLPGHPPAETLTREETAWREILPRTPIRPDHPNALPVEWPYRVTHLRLRIHPDGGIARLRVHGEAVPAPGRLGHPEGETDLAAPVLGGRVLAVSDRFFGAAERLLLPGPATHMGDGWETRRRRGGGNDWVVLALAAAGTVRRVLLDTRHFKGNAPGECSLEGTLAPGEEAQALLEREDRWETLLPRTPLQPDTPHEFVDELLLAHPVTHVRLQIYPDGGVARLRLLGGFSPEGRRRLGLAYLNRLPPEEARDRLASCCGARRWVEGMVRARPFAGGDELLATAARLWDDLEEEDWRQAFAAHPAIGSAEAAPGQTRRGADWSRREQAGVEGTPGQAREHLRQANRRYEERFGHGFIVFASGRSGEEMLAILEERLDNDPQRELEIAAREERKIATARLERLLRE